MSYLNQLKFGADKGTHNRRPTKSCIAKVIVSFSAPNGTSPGVVTRKQSRVDIGVEKRETRTSAFPRELLMNCPALFMPSLVNTDPFCACFSVPLITFRDLISEG